MDNFVVSARKYRPITFDSVVGQEHITTTLKNAVATQHLAQAFLFCGPRGVGKTTCARILAKTINCQNLASNTEACGTCDSCQSFQNNASFNIHELDAASNNSVDDIRSLIDQVRYPPSSGKYKIYIIDEVHMLSTAAFNAFLKTLEEPPAYAIFILATTEKHKILPTILSRCQNFDFNRIKVADMAAHLQKIANAEGVTAEPRALELIAQKADGGLRDALSMFDLLVTYAANNTLAYKEALENLHILDYDYYFRLIDQLQRGAHSEALLLVDEILKKGFDGHLFLAGILEHLRHLLLCKDPATVALLEVSEQVQQQYLLQAQQCNYSFLLSSLSLGSQADIHYKASKNQRLHLELCLLKMAHINQLLQLEAPSEAAEKKNPNAVANTPTEASKPNAEVIATPDKKLQPAPAEVDTTTTTIAIVAGPGGLSKLKTTKIQVPKTVANLAPDIVAITEQSHNSNTAKAIMLGDLDLPWQQFVQKLEAEERYNEAAILQNKYLLAGHVLTLQVESIVQQGIIADRTLEELCQHLRVALAQPTLRIQTEVVETTHTRKSIYTQSEKFQHMASKNANFEHFRKELGLDYDY
jgi:DNA polymerase III subunit gamma/tau